jgi:hypothetical protein
MNQMTSINYLFCKTRPIDLLASGFVFHVVEVPGGHALPGAPRLEGAAPEKVERGLREATNNSAAQRLRQGARSNRKSDHNFLV